MSRLTKEGVLGALSIDLIFKGEKLRKAGKENAGEALFKMAIDVVSKPQSVETQVEASGNKPNSPNP